MADSLQDFIPAQWELIASAQGDLNKDGLDDYAAIIEYLTEVSETRVFGDYTEEILGRPRILFMAFAKPGDGLCLSVQNNDLVLRAHEGGMMGDPFSDLAIERGAVRIDYYGGSSWRWAKTVRFRYQQDDWYLIGYTDKSYHTFGGKMTEYDYNPLTGKLKTTTGNIFEIECLPCENEKTCPETENCLAGERERDTVNRVVWKSLRWRPLVRIDAYHTWDVMGLIEGE